jgi:hypothetical protein
MKEHLKSPVINMLLLVCLLLSFLLAMILLAIEADPTVNTRANLSADQVAKVKRLFDRNDPRRLRTGVITTAKLGQEELDLALNYVVNQYANGAARLKIEQGKAQIEVSLPLPSNPLGRYLNFHFVLRQTNGLPEISAISLGRLPLPGFVAISLLKYSQTVLPITVDWPMIARMVKLVKFQPRRLLVTYQWRAELPSQVSGALVSKDELLQLEAYQRRLSELAQTGTAAVSLIDLMQPLFQLAVERSQNGNAIQENRAVIRVLAFYVNQKNLSKLMPQLKRWPRPIWRRVTLQNRDDFSKHYCVSAFLAADGGTPLANAVGLYKEIQDSRGGSGFSFNDIAADRAGTRMGELAIASEQDARALQRFLSTANEADIMPETADLPEFMPEAEFNRRYGGLQGDGYQNMMDEIERRIAALAINRR